jgi:hypothetical protein
VVHTIAGNNMHKNHLHHQTMLANSDSDLTVHGFAARAFAEKNNGL